ncbi:uncharacterized protein ACN427_014426 isoform 2-T3 [Glossina fuscipes fuscipes]
MVDNFSADVSLGLTQLLLVITSDLLLILILNSNSPTTERKLHQIIIMKAIKCMYHPRNQLQQPILSVGRINWSKELDMQIDDTAQILETKMQRSRSVQRPAILSRTREILHRG